MASGKPTGRAEWHSSRAHFRSTVLGRRCNRSARSPITDDPRWVQKKPAVARDREPGVGRPAVPPPPDASIDDADRSYTARARRSRRSSRHDAEWSMTGHHEYPIAGPSSTVPVAGRLNAASVAYERRNRQSVRVESGLLSRGSAPVFGNDLSTSLDMATTGRRQTVGGPHQHDRARNSAR